MKNQRITQSMTIILLHYGIMDMKNSINDNFIIALWHYRYEKFNKELD